MCLPIRIYYLQVELIDLFSVSRYDVILKQAVTTEDMYLQLGNKTPSSVCCEDMVVSLVIFTNYYSQHFTAIDC